MPYYPTYVENPLVKENPFRTRAPRPVPLPDFAEARAVLPRPYWEGHPEVLECYWRVWELAFQHLREPTPENGFVADYIDTAFNDNLFMWDSVFILLFARYGDRAFPFYRTLDNLYAKQHPDGFICREVRQADGSDVFFRHDPASTGPNLMPWFEWERYSETGDLARLAEVFPPLLAYHRWLRTYRTWQDGSYWACGLASGMDNQPRVEGGPQHAAFAHGHMTWVDATLQQCLAARLIEQMAEALGRQSETADLRQEREHLVEYANRYLWNDETGFYHDRRADGSLTPLKSVGAFWALLAGVATDSRADRLIAHLEDEREFCRPHRVPSLAADDPEYRVDGGYWLGGVWPPTNYMVLRGLRAVAREGPYRDLDHVIARNHLEQVVQVFQETGTVWENYAPEGSAPGRPAKPDFVGWSGLGPVAILFEHVFGLSPDAEVRRIEWDVRLLEEHGVDDYPLGQHTLVDLRCAARARETEEPRVLARLKHAGRGPVDLVVRWAGGSRVERLTP